MKKRNNYKNKFFKQLKNYTFYIKNKKIIIYYSRINKLWLVKLFYTKHYYIMGHGRTFNGAKVTAYQLEEIIT